jgi:hypothetical protein
MFDIVPAKSHVANRDYPDTVNNLDVGLRPQNTLQEGSDYENSFRLDLNYSPLLIGRSPDVPDGKQLICLQRQSPKIVQLRNFDPISQKEMWLYHLLLISGRWRNEKEMTMAPEMSLEEAITYHGIYIPEPPDSHISSVTYILYMLHHRRYSVDDIFQQTSRLLGQGIPQQNILTALDNLSDISVDRKQVVIEAINTFNNIISKANEPVQSLNQLSSVDLKDYIRIGFSDNEVADANLLLHDSLGILNTHQRTIYDTITNDIDISRGYIISGKAGTGKSFLLRCLMAFLIAHNIPYVVTASTGIAATLIGGRTVHSCFRIFSNENTHVSNLSISDRQGAALSHIRVLFIDEITMLSSSIFDILNRKLRMLRGARLHSNLEDKPFGGVIVILTGDLAQVPAVIRGGTDYDEATNMFTSMQDFDHFEKLQLITPMRQNSDETNFINLLDEVRCPRIGSSLSQSAIDLIKSRFVQISSEDELFRLQDFVSSNGNNGMVIYYTNSHVDNYNSLITKSMTSRDNLSLYSFDAKYVVKCKSTYIQSNNSQPISELFGNKRIASPAERKRYLNCRLNKEVSSLVPDRLQIFVGARIILLKNINQRDKMVNGRRGTITEIILGNTNEAPTLMVSFDPLPGDNTTVLYPIIAQQVDSVKFPDGKIVSMYQLPIRLAYAVTAHKAQGQTLDKVAVCIGEEAFAHGAFYVALSRVRRIEDIIFFSDQEFPDEGPQFHRNIFINELVDLIENPSGYNF